jgi:hypothetical protein
MKKETSQILILLAAIIAGFIIGKIDTSKNWDDTAITAALVFASSAVLGFINERRTWLSAILVAAPVVLLNIIASENYASVIAFAISFGGSYVGLLVRKLVNA